MNTIALPLHLAALAFDRKDAKPAAEGEALIHALFLRARQGEVDALEPLCRLMRPRLFRIAFSVVKDRDEADDVAQDAILRSLQKRNLFLGRGSASGWMGRIALNLAKNRYRDHKRRRQLAEGATKEELLRSRAPGARAAEQVLVDRGLQARVQAALNGLPNRQRNVLQLRLFGELSFADIGATLKMSEANARVTAAQGLVKMRQALADLEPGSAAERAE